MNVVVFIGPTLPVKEAEHLLSARYLPPAAMGDVYNAVERDRPEIIAIIDGYFDSVPSVWHKEILFALSRGIRVIGASSIGALRAAELHSFGMEGFGWVYEAFRSGALEDDDEVALVHTEDHRPLSAAMVNIRTGLQRAANRGILSQTVREAMLTLAKRRFYPQRSWKQLYVDAAEFGIDPIAIDSLRNFVEQEHPDIKREDACDLLTRLAAGRLEPSKRAVSELGQTIFWDKLASNERKLAPLFSPSVRGEAVRRFVKATNADLTSLQRTGLLLHLVQKESSGSGLNIDQRQFDDALEHFRLRHRLITRESMKAWLEREGLSTEQFRELMYAEARIETMLKTYQREVEEHLLESLALSGCLGNVLSKFLAGEVRLQDSLPEEAGSATAHDLEVFYRKHVREFGGSLQRHARELGFSSASELLDEVRKIYRKESSKGG
jgi:hypothetical protein